ncbi:MAG: acyltransferase, partial [Bacteroidales bacterium]|nr:acyltransferase [Bacteroidales bacterium]
MNSKGVQGNVFTKDDTQKVKGLAIILMLIHHCFLNKARYKGQLVIFTPFSEIAVNEFAYAMKICVAIFTFLSAYGIYLSYQKKINTCNEEVNLKNIYILVFKRLISLLTGYWFVFLTVQLYSLIVVRDGRYLRVYGSGTKGVLFFLIDFLGLAELFNTPTFLATFWYMSLAILIVLLMPFLVMCYKKIGAILLIAFSVLFAVLFPVNSKHTMAYLPWYLTCLCLGMVSASRNWLVSFKKLSGESNCLKRASKAAIELIIIALFLYCRQTTRNTLLLPIWDSLLPFLIVVFMFEYINNIPVVGSSLQFLGVHSMNIFLIHNFIRVIWYFKFTYSFRYAPLIVIVLLGVSLAVSFVLENLKRLLRYDRAID